MTTETAGRAEFVEWARTHAIPLATADPAAPLDDLAALAPLIGDARVVSLGESTHGTSEFFTLKHRFVQLLDTLPGFDTFLMESVYDESHEVDAWVRAGRGDAGAALEGMKFWTWNTEEVSDVLVWLRDHSWRFAGFDPQFCHAASPAHPEESVALGAYARDRGEAMRKASSAEGIWKVREIRDEAMAQLAVRLLAEGGPQARAAVWAHNQHVGRDGFNGRFPSMGAHLERLLPGEHMVVGFLFGRGGFRAMDANHNLVSHQVPMLPDSVEAALDEVGEPLFVLNLRALPEESAAAGWLASRPLSRLIGADFTKDGGQPTDLTEQYDLVVYVAQPVAARGRPTGPGSRAEAAKPKVTA